MKKVVLMCLLFFLCGITDAQTSPRLVDAATFKKLIDQKKYVLIDLRTGEEILHSGMIAGAIQIDYLAEGFDERIRNLDHKVGYLLYCAGGGRSSDCAELMDRLGFENVVELDKGYDHWKKKGFDTVKN